LEVRGKRLEAKSLDLEKERSLQFGVRRERRSAFRTGFGVIQFRKEGGEVQSSKFKVQSSKFKKLEVGG
jgi:hypothetical protein